MLTFATSSSSAHGTQLLDTFMKTVENRFVLSARCVRLVVNCMLNRAVDSTFVYFSRFISLFGGVQNMLHQSMDI